MNFRKLGIATGVLAALCAGSVGQAHADAFAEAEVLISNVIFTKGGTTPFAATDFSQLSVQDTLTNTAILNPGAFDSHGAVVTQPPFVPSVYATHARVA